MKEIDLETWNRKEHFKFFLKNDLPFYNTTFNIDITGLPEFAKKKKLSLTNCITFLTIKSLSQIENFLYRLENNKIIQYDKLDISITYLREGEELFRLITVEYDKNLESFNRKMQEAIDKSNQYFDVSMLQDRSNFVFISSLPWIYFTSIDHTLSLKKEDSIPRITWGKFLKKDGVVLLPFNMRVNHIFIDGFHIGKFHEILQQEIKALIG